MNQHIAYKPISPIKKQFKFLKGSVIVIDGIIGVGKSTLGNSITKYLNRACISTKFFPEYFNKQLLDYFLSDIKTHAFMFQVIMANTRVELYRRALLFAQSGGISIIDRSILGDIAFASMYHENGDITSEQYNIYWSIINEAKDLYAPDYTIFLNCDIDTCTRRIKNRNIDSEVSTYDTDYHNRLVKSYKNVYNKHRELEVIYINYDTDDTNLDNGILSNHSVHSILKKCICKQQKGKERNILI